MRIVVFGASGGVGRWAVRAGAAAGHDVVAAARATSSLPMGVVGVDLDVRQPEAVRRAIEGVDAVLWCIGVTKRSGADVGRTAMPHVVAAADEFDVSRLAISGAGVTLPGDRKGPGARLVSALTRRLARDLVLDKEGEHAVLDASGLMWTEVRPPRLVDREPTNRWSLVDQPPGVTAKPVAKADVALAMIDVAGTCEWTGRSPFVVAG